MVNTSSHSYSKENAINALIALNLPKWEAKTYVALYGSDTSLASDIARVANIAQPKIYGYLNSLVEKTFVTRQIKEGSPDTFTAVPYDIVLDSLKSQVLMKADSAAKYFEETKRFQRTRNVEDLFSYFEGEKAVYAGLKGVIENIQKNVIILLLNPAEEAMIMGLLEDRKKTSTNLVIYQLAANGKVKKIPPIKKLLNTEGFKELLVKRPSMFFTDVDLTEATGSSLNISFPSLEDFPPALINIKHPIALHFQIQLYNSIYASLHSLGLELVEK